MVVKLTQEQADYLKTFGEEKSKAFHYISRWGWGHLLSDGNGKVYEHNEEKPFEQDEDEKMLNALINGYEVAVPKFKFYNFSDKSGNTPLYYNGEFEELTYDVVFAKEVKKDSEEYLALTKLGFVREEL